MNNAKQALVTATTTKRRQFTGLLCASGLLTMAGCGGGSGSGISGGGISGGGISGGGTNVSTAPADVPHITLAPQSASFALGQSITLRAEASGSDLVYQWRRNGVALKGATGSSLLFTAAPADDGAQYSVWVSNAAGQVESPVATLTLKAASEITLLAGAIGSGGSIVDGEGAQARFAWLGASCLDKDGHLYVIEPGAKTLRKITPAGVVSTVFTNFPSEGGVAVDADGYFYGVRDRGITRVSPSGEQKVWAGQSGLGWADGVGSGAQFARPMGLVIDAQGNLLVGDSPEITGVAGLPPFFPSYLYGSTIRKITPAGVVSTIAGTPGQNITLPSDAVLDPDLNFIYPDALTSDGNGRVWVSDRSGVRRIDAPGATPVRIWSNTRSVGGVAYALGSPGDVYVADGNTILKLGANGTQTVVAGGAGAPNTGVQLGALPASLGAISFLVSVSARVLYVGSDNAVLRIQLS